VVGALLIDVPALALGVNTLAGNVTCAPVAEAHGLAHTRLFDLLS